jgi:hypothetical protein
MLRLLLVITILATIAHASAADEGSQSANPFGVLAGATITCSATSAVAGCYLEHRILTLGALEVTLGIDAQAAYAGGRSGHLAPYAGAAWYAPTWSAWLEVYLPQSGIPTIGRPDWWRVGFTWRFP